MATEPDLSALLPAPPPPRPARREAAIDAALRRFGGEPAPVGRGTARRGWRVAGRPYLGAAGAAALVAAIGLPLWLSDVRRPATTTRGSFAGTVESAAPAPPSADAAAEPAPTGPLARAPMPDVAPAPRADAFAPTEPRPSAEAAESTATAPPVAPPPPAPAAAALATAAPDEAKVSVSNIVVTGARVAARNAGTVRRVEQAAWSACTIDDPGQDRAACRTAVAGSATGATGRALSVVNDGMALAWRGDLDGAIAAFDRAITIAPKLSSAWLNRGLARAKTGDDAGALADLDNAIRYAPRRAQGWFHRSLILRRQGKIARADADAARAAELDPRYEGAIE